MARKSHRKNRRQARHVSFIKRSQWLAPIGARTAATLLLMLVARLLHVAPCGG